MRFSPLRCIRICVLLMSRRLRERERMRLRIIRFRSKQRLRSGTAVMILRCCGKPASVLLWEMRRKSADRRLFCDRKD